MTALRFTPILYATLCLSLLCNCTSDDRNLTIPSEGPWNSGVYLEPEPFEQGDAAKGWYSLLHGNYMSCGIPYKLWANEWVNPTLRDGLGAGASAATIPERTGKNADMPYAMNAFTTVEGVEVVNFNCLQCHGGHFNGEFILGLGTTDSDFTEARGEGTGEIPAATLETMGLNEAEQAEFYKITRRGSVIGPETVMRTVGNNPAEALAIILMLHHDRDTLEWSDEPLMELVVKDAEGSLIETAVMTSDPPPWWRAHKKNALFYNGMARGDHRGTMMLATSVCVDTLEEAHRVDKIFMDIQEYIRSLREPKYPFAIDKNLAYDGEEVFVQHCAGCHGTYDENESKETYPNLLIPLDIIGTDPVLAQGGIIHSPELVEWYNGSFYGSVTRMEPRDSKSGVVGYVPQPLDGIWATGPFLHNGSVPTLAQLLDSSTRPDVWRRTSFDTTEFDETKIGWPHEALEFRQEDAPPTIRKFVYDTGYWSQSNKGHTFGDGLSETERKTLLEYLKTI